MDVLKGVQTIAAEDTRVTSRLLQHYGITGAKLIALHEHNESRTAPRIVSELEAGRSVALVSDAGTPAFSDPGARLVSAVREAGYKVVPIPGANAAAAALSASGFGGTQFLFYGFLPAKTGERRTVLETLSRLPFLLVLYEAPHRVEETVADLASTFGSTRQLVIARELTKLFESIHTCTLGEAGAWLSADPNRLKGEFVLLVEGAPQSAEVLSPEVQRTLEVLVGELPLKQAAQLTAKITGASKNDLYELGLRLKREASGET